jgi:AcrR family transcriptional regulator
VASSKQREKELARQRYERQQARRAAARAKARRRQQILAAAARLFAERPYGAVQMDDVARHAAVGKATLYRYFPSKEELYLAVFDDALSGLGRRFAELATAGLAPSARLDGMLRAMVDVLAEQVASLRLLDFEHADLAGRWRSVFRARRQALVDALGEVLDAGCRSGEFRAVDPDVTPALLVGMIRGGLMGAPNLPRARLADAAVALVLGGGLRGPAPG